jgi:thiamine transporter ThiT
MRRASTLQRTQSVSSLTLVASMGAVGNLLGVVAIFLGRIPTPGVTQVALDFSSLAVVIVGIFAGWRLGALTGLIAGLGPMVMFGYVYGSTGIITVLLPVGKALTGLFVGLISQWIGSARKLRVPFVLAAVWVGFIPEAVLTWFYFVNLVPFFVPGAFAGPTAATLVLVKGWAEMIIIAFLTVALIGNAGFRSFLGRLASIQGR